MNGKISKELLDEIVNMKDSRVEALFLSEEDFKKLENPAYDLSGEKEKDKSNLLEVYRNIIDVLKYYCDIEEKYYSIIALWIIGTYYHKDFPTYPYLFFNAMRGSGKSRVLRLITTLSKDGSMLNSLTEAVLFRTTGTLGIDEFEGISRKGNEALKELLNSAYKKGIKVKRMRKVKGFDGERQEVEEFEIYRPIVLANINGMEEVLGDRCIQIILSKSNNSRVIKKVEDYDNNTNITEIKSFQRDSCRLCSVVSLSEVYRDWNTFINNIDTNNTNTTHNTNNTNNTTDLFNILNDSNIDGRNLELMLPLIIIAYSIEENIFKDTINTLKEIVQEKKKEDIVESIDIALIDFISQQLESKWYLSKDILKDFKQFMQLDDEWINERWLGKALKRLSLVRDKKRMNYGRMYMFDINKAQDKIKIFKVKED